MDNNYGEQLLIMQATIEAYRQDSNDKMKKLTEELKAMITSTITPTVDQVNISKSSPYQKD